MKISRHRFQPAQRHRDLLTKLSVFCELEVCSQVHMLLKKVKKINQEKNEFLLWMNLTFSPLKQLQQLKKYLH